MLDQPPVFLLLFLVKRNDANLKINNKNALVLDVYFTINQIDTSECPRHVKKYNLNQSINTYYCKEVQEVIFNMYFSCKHVPLWVINSISFKQIEDSSSNDHWNVVIRLKRSCLYTIWYLKFFGVFIQQTSWIFCLIFLYIILNFVLNQSTQLFDPDEEGYIEYDNFATPIQTVLQIDNKYIKLIYQDMDCGQTGKVTRGKENLSCLYTKYQRKNQKTSWLTQKRKIEFFFQSF